jgi:flagellar biosynthesis GTPase FlhF
MAEAVQQVFTHPLSHKTFPNKGLATVDYNRRKKQNSENAARRKANKKLIEERNRQWREQEKERREERKKEREAEKKKKAKRDKKIKELKLKHRDLRERLKHPFQAEVSMDPTPVIFVFEVKVRMDAFQRLTVVAGRRAIKSIPVAKQTPMQRRNGAFGNAMSCQGNFVSHISGSRIPVDFDDFANSALGRVFADELDPIREARRTMKADVTKANRLLSNYPELNTWFGFRKPSW